MTTTIPIANFTASPLSGSPTLNVAFRDLSTNTPTNWLWNFGDNTSSVIQNPIHSYPNAGIYSVTLTVTNAAGKSVPVTKTNLINVISPTTVTPTTAPITTAPITTAPITTAPITTAPITTAPITTTPTTVAPVVTTKPPVVTTSPPVVTIKPNIPVATFTVSSQMGPAPLTVKFTDASTGNPTSWLWEFDDNNNTSTLQHPTYNFVNPGIYNVKLTTTNPGSTNKIVTMTIVATKPCPLVACPVITCPPINCPPTFYNMSKSKEIGTWSGIGIAFCCCCVLLIIMCIMYMKK